MSALLTSEATHRRLENVLTEQPQSLLIVGQKGSGRMTVARAIAAGVLQQTDDALQHYPYFSIIKPDGSSVKIEQIQNLKKMLSLKTPAVDKKIQRIIVIESADLMTRDAQNAALKFIEEPPADTMIILIAENERDMLQTIRSRCSVYMLANPDEQTALQYTHQVLHIDELIARKQYQLSGGRAGLFLALVQDTDHPLVAAINRARSLLASSKFEKVAMVDELSKDKELAQNILFALDRIAQVGLQQAAEKQQLAQTKRWAAVLQSLEDAAVQLKSNTNSKLIFTNLMLAL